MKKTSIQMLDALTYVVWVSQTGLWSPMENGLVECLYCLYSGRKAKVDHKRVSMLNINYFSEILQAENNKQLLPR